MVMVMVMGLQGKWNGMEGSEEGRRKVVEMFMDIYVPIYTVNSEEEGRTSSPIVHSEEEWKDL